MDDELETVMVDVRASTRGFAADIAEMRGAVDGQLLGGFEKAGQVLERGLLSAIRKGNLGFEELKNVAVRALEQIASQALQGGLSQLLGSTGGASGGGGLGSLLAGSIGALFGLPGRATGGPVSPGRGYLVGERGPELFVPTSAGRVEPEIAAPRTSVTPPATMPLVAQSQRREVRVAINLAPQRGASAPTALRRSSRQVASAVRRALADG